MIYLKTPAEIKIMARGGKILARILEQTEKIAKPGITKQQIDQEIEKMILSAGAIPSFKNFKGFPNASCLSLNEELVHGLPNRQKIHSGDILGIDMGVFYQGFHTDAAVTIPIGDVNPQAKDLLAITKKSLDLAIEQIAPGVRLGVIQKTIQNLIESHGYSLVRSFTGHGIGQSLQEEPVIPNYYGKNSNLILKEGMVICLEPMVIASSNYQVKIKSDNWTVISADNSLAAHFEHTIAIIKDGCQVLTVS